MKCLYCKSNHTVKNGYGRGKSIRMLCRNCDKTFSLGGKRGTYSKEFKQKVMENYCHKRITAKEVVKRFGISTRTLIKWKKEHKSFCKYCLGS